MLKYPNILFEDSIFNFFFYIKSVEDKLYHPWGLWGHRVRPNPLAEFGCDHRAWSRHQRCQWKVPPDRLSTKLLHTWVPSLFNLLGDGKALTEERQVRRDSLCTKNCFLCWYVSKENPFSLVIAFVELTYACVLEVVLVVNSESHKETLYSALNLFQLWPELFCFSTKEFNIF